MLFQKIFRNMDSCISSFLPSQISLIIPLLHVKLRPHLLFTISFLISSFLISSFLISSFLYLPSHSSLSSFQLYFHFDCHKYFYTYYSPEFIGRIPRIVPLHPLTENDLVRIIQDPEDSLLSQVPPFTSVMLFAYLASRVNF